MQHLRCKLAHAISPKQRKLNLQAEQGCLAIILHAERHIPAQQRLQTPFAAASCHSADELRLAVAHMATDALIHPVRRVHVHANVPRADYAALARAVELRLPGYRYASPKSLPISTDPNLEI